MNVIASLGGAVGIILFNYFIKNVRKYRVYEQSTKSQTNNVESSGVTLNVRKCSLVMGHFLTIPFVNFS